MKDIAIIGIGSILPDAPDFTEFWNNILSRKCSVGDISSRCAWVRDAYDPDPAARDKTYVKTAALLDPVEFDPLGFGMPPKVLQSTSVDQIYGLLLARQALTDAGLLDGKKQFDRKRTGVIVSAQLGQNIFQLTTRLEMPSFRRAMLRAGIPEDKIDRVTERCRDSVRDWDESSNPGYLANIVAGRIANRFDLGGTSCAIDAACGSSLAAVKAACRELEDGTCSLMLAGGVTIDHSASIFVSFSKCHALSPTGKIRPFDAGADGMILGDGMGMVVLKRLEDARRDKDRIYAVIKGCGSSSDGRAASIYAPSKDGQQRAIKNACADAGVSIDSIGLFEAHGTGTRVGDAVEIGALSELCSPEGTEAVIGSVKGQIGHLRMAAGIAGLIKAALCLYHKVLPPSVGCVNENPALAGTALHLTDEPLPWVTNSLRPIRRAGVSAFGFGGTNFHIILEENEHEQQAAYSLTREPRIFFFTDSPAQGIEASLRSLLSQVQAGEDVFCGSAYRVAAADGDSPRLAFIAAAPDELRQKCGTALGLLAEKPQEYTDRGGVIFSPRADRERGVCALFPGQGSQYVGMLSGMACAFPPMRGILSLADDKLIKKGLTPVSRLMYPLCMDKDRPAHEKELTKTENAQPALACAGAAMYDILRSRGVEAGLFIGHSFGELVALWADGAYDLKTLIDLSCERGRLMADAGGSGTGMLAVMASRELVSQRIKKSDNIYIANDNSPRQTVVSGNNEELSSLAALLGEEGVRCVPLKVSAAFHSPYMSAASEAFGAYLRRHRRSLRSPGGRVAANCDVSFYGSVDSVIQGLKEQIVSPVLFRESVLAAYDKGARIFIECGAGNTLSKLTGAILEGRSGVKILPLAPDRGGDPVRSVEQALCALAVIGLTVKDDPWRAAPEPELMPRKTASSVTVGPDFFSTPEFEQRVKDALSAVDEPSDTGPAAAAGSAEAQDNEERSNDDMAISDPQAEISRINSEVLEKYFEIQERQLQYVSGLFVSDDRMSEDTRRGILDCMTVFQQNTAKVMEMFFDRQKSVLAGACVPAAVPAAAPAPVQEKSAPAEKPAAVSGPVSGPAKSAAVSVAKAEAVEPSSAPGTQSAAKPAGKADTAARTAAVIGEKTGYPADMIEQDMELEADLGIDSIKRFEIFSAIADNFGLSFTPADTEKLPCLSTVGAVSDFVSGKIGD